MIRAKVLFTALTLCAACDNGEPTTTAQPDEVAESEPEDGDEIDGFRGRHHHGPRHKGDLAERLCEKLDCSDDQYQQVVELFDGERPRGERPDHSAANKTLADAFRGDAFSETDVEAYTSAVRPSGDRKAKEAGKMEKLHAILTPEQRGILADKIEERGFFGHRPKGKRGDKDGRGAEHRVDRMCERLSCTDDQKNDLTAIVKDAKGDPPEASGDVRKTMADAMRAETFDRAAVEKALEKGKARHTEREEARADALVAIHGVLDAKQRGQVADRMEEHGAGALMGGHGKHRRHGKGGPHGKGKRHGKGKGKGKGKGRRGPPPGERPFERG